MRIGILTFHWATNYGAVLQTFALQKFVSQLCYEVRIINYVPKSARKTVIWLFRVRSINAFVMKLRLVIQEKAISKFRKEYLKTSRLYSSLDELVKAPPDFDGYICGSDQVWNPYFLRNGENKITPVYFLPFGNKSVKRIAYAASMGCRLYPGDLISEICKWLSNFSSISVRENSAKHIIKSAMDINVPVVLDPTLLLSVDDYLSLVEQRPINKKYGYIFCLGHFQKRVQNYLVKLLEYEKIEHIDSRSLFECNVGVNGWLSRIYHAEYVITNSYHCAVFSILFKKKFVVIKVSGELEGMNDRIDTLLELLGLSSRAIDENNVNNMNAVLNSAVDWSFVDRQCATARLYSSEFLQKAISCEV